MSHQLADGRLATHHFLLDQFEEATTCSPGPGTPDEVVLTRT